MNDTITAIVTPMGEGGISVLRLSGTQALAIASRLFRPARDADLKEFSISGRAVNNILTISQQYYIYKIAKD